MSKTKCASIRKTSIGGQALIEGIMMMGPDKIATVLLKKDGSHVVRERNYVSPKKKCFLWGLPLIRGIVSYGSSISRGVSELMFAADNAEIEDTEPSKFDKWIEKKFGMEKAQKFLMGFAVVLGIAFPIALFILLPALVAGVFDFFGDMPLLRSIFEGMLRMVIFISFIYLTSLPKDMRRVYGFHGAEHKTIYCYESGEELTVENVRKHSRRHPRCGTSFLFIIIIISILIFSFIGVSNIWLRLLFRLLLLPLVCGISYELLKLAGRYDNWFTKALRAPGVAMQTITTKEPDDQMIETAIDALKRVIPGDKGADNW